MILLYVLFVFSQTLGNCTQVVAKVFLCSFVNTKCIHKVSRFRETHHSWWWSYLIMMAIKIQKSSQIFRKWYWSNSLSNSVYGSSWPENYFYFHVWYDSKEARLFTDIGPQAEILYYIHTVYALCSTSPPQKLIDIAID